MNGIVKVINDAGVSCVGQGIGPVFQTWFSEQEITFIILNCPGTFTIGALGEDKAFDEGLNRRTYGCL